MIKKITVILLLANVTSSFTQLLDDLHDINFQDSDLTVMLDNQVRSLCDYIKDLQKLAGVDCSDEYLNAFLNQQATEFEYEIVLRGLHCCLNTSWKPQTEQELMLYDSLTTTYNELCEEYNQLIKQLSTRRIKCKCFTKVTTRELVACNAKVHNNLTTNNLFVGNCLQVSGFGANQAVITDSNGCLSSVAQITNALLAPNSVTGGPSGTITNNTITPSNLAFNTFQAFATEPNPLTIIRGSVSADAVTTVGQGFIVNKTGTGIYTVQFIIPYVNATAYQIFVQPTFGYNNPANAIYIRLSNQQAQTFDVHTFDSTGNPADENFVFFAIGSLT